MTERERKSELKKKLNAEIQSLCEKFKVTLDIDITGRMGDDYEASLIATTDDGMDVELAGFYC